jgi:hypothetical protein
MAGKEQVWAAIHDERGAALLERAVSVAGSAGSALEALLLGVAAYVEFLSGHPAYLRIHLRESQPWAIDPRFSSAVQRRQWQEGLELTVAVFRQGIADGTLVVDGPPGRRGLDGAAGAELGARTMIAAHQVFLADWVESGMSEPVAALVTRMQGFVRRAFAV